MSSSSVRSAAKQRICDAALQHFVEHGYDGASLTQIAEMVGIRKASIYAHFQNKDALFLTLLDDAIAAETTFIQKCFTQDQGLPGQAYCMALEQRYQDSLFLRFLLRNAYVPPMSLKEHIVQQYALHYAIFEQQIATALQPHHRNTAQYQLLIHAYLGMVDSLHVELLYAGTARFSLRLNAMWAIFQHALNAEFEV